ncbi:MAG: DUF58 domain-containing protein [Pseudomonadota bacterium]
MAVIGEALSFVALLPWLGLFFVGLADIALSRRRSGNIEVDAPTEVFVGEDLTLTLRDSGARAGQRMRFNLPDGLSGQTEAAFSPDGTATVTLGAKRRGTWDIPFVWLLWPSRLALFEFIPKLPIGGQLRVVPNIRQVQSGALTTKIMSALIGVKENRAIGEGSEFHQLREFVSGMDVKSIDWKRSARTRTLLGKELRAERNHHVILAVDTGFLMREEIGGLAKIDHAVTAALAVAWSATLGGDLVGHFSYDVQPRTFAKPMAGRGAFVRMRSWAAEIDYVARETNHTLALSELNARTPKRSLIIIFTDFVDTTSAELMLENIAILAKRHLIVFVAIRDPEIDDRLTKPPDAMSDVATLVAVNQSISERRLVLERLNRLGVTVVDAKPDQITGRLIAAYLDIKERELI